MANSMQQSDPKRRLAVTAPAPATALLNLLHNMVGHSTCESAELMRPTAESVVKVIGWREVQSQRSRRSHLVYTILAAAPSEANPKETSDARLVQRRYRDFAKLHATLLPRARQAGISLPALPSKLTSLGRRLSPELGAQRQRALHAYLCWIVSHPPLMCAELRLFLGLAPRVYSMELKADAISDVDTMDADVDMDEKMADARADEAFAVDLAQLERIAVECMLDDELWGRR